MRKLTIIVLAVALVFALTGVGLMAEQKRVTVGSKAFTEQLIVGELLKQALEARGFEVKLTPDLSSMVMRKAMETGEIDICAEYTGTAWMVHLAYPYNPVFDHEDLYWMVKVVDETDHNLIWLDPMWNHNSYAFAVWRDFAEEHDIWTMSDLAQLYLKKEGKIKMFVTIEFAERPDGQAAMEEYYNFYVDRDYLLTGVAGMSVHALAERETEVGMVFATDAAVAVHDWVVLRDDMHFWPPYDLTPIVRGETLKRYPEIGEILNELVASFPGGGEAWTPEYMTAAQLAWSELNGKVDIEKMDPDEAAREFLVEQGLVGK